MSVYQFTLIVEGPDLQSDNAVDALFEAGCNDALVGRADGIQYLDFDRAAPNPETAILPRLLVSSVSRESRRSPFRETLDDGFNPIR